LEELEDRKKRFKIVEELLTLMKEEFG